MGNPATFWPEALPWAQQAHNATGVLTSVILAQVAIETEYGGPDWTVHKNPGNVGSFDGQPVASFPTLAEGWAAYTQLMNAPDRPEFAATIRKATTYQQQAYLLGAANPVWASARYTLPGGAPGSEIVSIIGTYRLTQYDGAVPTPTPTPTPTPAPIQEDEMATSDPETGKVYGTDANGNFYGEGIADMGVCTLGEHPEWKAGEAESAGQNPCVGIVPWKDPSGKWGYAYVTKPTSGSGSMGIYSTYHITHAGQPA